ncbi:VOC family protein [Nocardioides abyssi]|uniref:VOC family protein n=1 Tax=Nocardioides abyssi TaxID=3058370 RepID=A0ABT8EPN0_9ACTN|nr:VOC family protein [Nocardioides abyssi]MDN4160122.1 VOC family protein [Nocardioides abyssi]
MNPSWLTAFLDLAPDDLEPAVAHWAAVTGYGVSTTRGDDGEFASLLPADGDPHLKVQRLGEGPSRLHLDLHVPEVAPAVERAVALGATLLADGEYAVLESPGGFPFCFVTHRAAVRPAAVDWGGHTSLVDQVCLDVPPRLLDRELAFWTEVTGWTARPAGREFHRLTRPPQGPLQLLVQRLDDDQPRVTAHLDLSTDDRPAETARHEALGATVTGVFDEWTAMRPPAGPPYCITDRVPDTVDPG